MKLLHAPHALLLAVASLLPGCGGTLGPLVTDVSWGKGGELLVTRCMLDISSAGNITTYNMQDCKQTTQRPPSGAAAAPNRGSAHAASATPASAPPASSSGYVLD